MNSAPIKDQALNPTLEMPRIGRRRSNSTQLSLSPDHRCDCMRGPKSARRPTTAVDPYVPSRRMKNRERRAKAGRRRIPDKPPRAWKIDPDMDGRDEVTRGSIFLFVPYRDRLPDHDLA